MGAKALGFRFAYRHLSSSTQSEKGELTEDTNDVDPYGTDVIVGE